MNIVFITVVSFPYGGASSSRTRNLVKLLTSCGNTVHVISDFASNEQIDVENCTYEAVPQGITNLSKAELSLKALKEYCKQCPVDVVGMNAKCDRFWLISQYCSENGIKLIIENCEWYDSSNFKHGEKDPEYVQNQKMIEEGFKQADGFISISRLLDEHNSHFGRYSVRIPTILDSEEVEYSTITQNERIKLIYTGRAGKSKEFLKPIIDALVRDKLLKEKMQFDIYGLNLFQLLRNINYDILLFFRARKLIHIHGNVEQVRMPEIIRKSDFQIFVRPNRRSSNAGFPTKLGESMMVGTPVIANDTGDICLYLRDGENGFVINGTGRKDVQTTLRRVIDLKSTERQNMRKKARLCAEQNFDYRKYQKHILDLLQNL